MVLVKRYCRECEEWMSVGPNVAKCPTHKTALRPRPGAPKARNEIIRSDDSESLRIKMDKGTVKASVIDYKIKDKKLTEKMIDIRFMYRTANGGLLYSKQGVMFPYSEKDRLAEWLQNLEDDEEYYEEPKAVPVPTRQLHAHPTPLRFEDIISGRYKRL